MPYLWPRVPVRTLDAISSPEINSNRSLYEMNLSGIASDIEFENILNELYWVVSQAAVRISDAEQQTQTILELIRGEIALRQ